MYLYDIIIFNTILEEHFINLKKVLEVLRRANLKVSLNKSEFFKKETEFLGHLILPQKELNLILKK